ncbi:hypothetical protein, partial [Pseudoduganella plicata]
MDYFACKADKQADIRLIKINDSATLVSAFLADGVGREHSIDRWRNELRWTAGGVELGSWDYRSNDTRRVGAA